MLWDKDCIGTGQPNPTWEPEAHIINGRDVIEQFRRDKLRADAGVAAKVRDTDDEKRRIALQAVATGGEAVSTVSLMDEELFGAEQLLQMDWREEIFGQKHHKAIMPYLRIKGSGKGRHC